MAEFTYNNAKNTSTSHTLFELNYVYYPRVIFEKNISSRLRFHSADKLAEKLKSWWKFVVRTYSMYVMSWSYMTSHVMNLTWLE